MLEQQKFRGDGADATRVEAFREGDKQVDRQDGQIAHQSNVITPPNLRKTARKAPFGLEFTNSPPTRESLNVPSHCRFSELCP
jgi:hypothetical protein